MKGCSKNYPVGRTNWRIIVEKDESEVITDYYRKYTSDLYPLLADAVQKQTAVHKKMDNGALPPHRDAKRVDVSELVKAGNRNELFTPGLATCTGVVAHRNSGPSYRIDFEELPDLGALIEKEQD